MKTKLISITPEAETLIMYCARVSNPANQTSENPQLLKYCIYNKHWSIFEMADMTIEIETSRAIAAQILRHKSFCFQEFSQRYAEIDESSFEEINPRRQDLNNRQNSIDDLDEDLKKDFKNDLRINQNEAFWLYQHYLNLGVAKESARFFLPLNTKTKLYMKGSVRSFIHYLQVRLDKSTQLEHRQIAEEIQALFVKELPILAKALEW